MPHSSIARFIGPLRLIIYVAAALTALGLAGRFPPRRFAGTRANGQSSGGNQRRSGAIADGAAAAAAPPKSKAINILALAVAGGIFMIPIAAMSILAVTMTIERLAGPAEAARLARRSGPRTRRPLGASNEQF